MCLLCQLVIVASLIINNAPHPHLHSLQCSRAGCFVAQAPCFVAFHCVLVECRDLVCIEECRDLGGGLTTTPSLLFSKLVANFSHFIEGALIYAVVCANWL